MFGVSLENIVNKEKTHIPKFVKKACHYIVKHGLHKEGIGKSFHTKKTEELNGLIKKINEGQDISFDAIGDVHAVVLLLRHFLASLPEPPFTYNNYDELMKIAEEIDVTVRLSKLKECIEKLNKPNKCLLDYIIYLALLIVDKSEMNKMDAKKMAATLSPLLISKHGLICFSEVSEIDKAGLIVEELINNYKLIFQNVDYPEKSELTIPDCPNIDQYRNIVLFDNQIRKQLRGVNILCLDGGGMRGLSSVMVLSNLATRLFGDDGPEGTKKLISCFDLIVGTSTGGIISIGLASGRFSIQQLRELYYTLGREIFAPGYFYKAGRWIRYYKSGDYYSGQVMLEILKKEFNDEPLTSIPHKVIVTTTDATCSIWKPFLLRSFENPKSPYNGTCDVPIPIAMRSTSAAPTFFSPVRFDGKTIIDGGLLANNPTELGIFEAHHIWPDRFINLVVSIGTGTPKNGTGSESILQLVDEIVDIATSSQIIHERVKQWVSLTSPRPGYFRFSPHDIGSVRMDEADLTVLRSLEESTQKYIEQPEQLESIESIRRILVDEMKQLK